jgi:uncharacterized protein
MTKVFLDTAYFIALVSTSDAFHLKAYELSQWVADSHIETVTTRAVLLEVGNALSKRRYRQAAARLLESIERNVDIEVVPLTESLYVQALALFKSRADKEWGLVDCVSCIVMQEQGISEVLTADSHFQQMGFRALLCEPES